MQDVNISVLCGTSYHKKLEDCCGFTDFLLCPFIKHMKSLKGKGSSGWMTQVQLQHVKTWATVTFNRTIWVDEWQHKACWLKVLESQGKKSEFIPFSEGIFTIGKGQMAHFLWCPLHVEILKTFRSPWVQHTLKRGFTLSSALISFSYSWGRGRHFLFGAQLLTFNHVRLRSIVFVFFVIIILLLRYNTSVLDHREVHQNKYLDRVHKKGEGVCKTEEKYKAQT